MALALLDSQLAVLQINVSEAKPDEFGIADARKDQQFQHRHMRQLAGTPDRVIERDQLRVCEQLRQSLGRWGGSDLEQFPRMLKDLLQIVVLAPGSL
jgi:hypothetical protein